MVKAPAVVYASVPTLWPDSTVVILAGGPSLTQADVDCCRDRARVIAIKDAVRLAPWADVLYGCDAKFWRAHPETATFTGPKYGLEVVRDRPDVQILKNTGDVGLELDPSGLRTGRNSGYQSIGLAVHLGAHRILLLGYDCKPDKKGTHHWFGVHPYGTTTPPYALFLQHFPTLIKPLAALGITVINCTRSTALDCFPTATLTDALADQFCHAATV